MPTLPEVSPEKYQERLELLLRHIQHVRENCFIIGNKLIEEGDIPLGRQLIANGLIHDNSKLHGLEWECLHGEVKKDFPDLFSAACKQHVTTNPHHPEYWARGIHEMSQLYVAEMVADWAARGAEFGTGFWPWVREKGMEKFNFGEDDAVYSSIKRYADLLLEPVFV